MLAPRLLALSFACVVGSACADSEPVNPSGGGGTGMGGAGGGGSGGTPTVTVTTGPTCSEDPCKLVEPQCGCPDGYACTIDASGTRQCLTAGAASQGQACDQANLCEAGTICVGGNGLLSCAKFCDTDAECTPPGGKCVVDVNGADGVLLCTENCNLVGSQGCLLAGTACQYGLADDGSAYTMCGQAGAALAEALCTTSNDCAPGFVCLGTSETPPTNRCFQWCDTAAPDTCPPAFANCQAVEISGQPLQIGDTTYGACTP